MRLRTVTLCRLGGGSWLQVRTAAEVAESRGVERGGVKARKDDPARKVVSAGRWEHWSTGSRSVGRGPWRGPSARSEERAVWSQVPVLEPDWLEQHP